MYFISSVSNGIGGHYYSLKSTVEALETENECVIVQIGPNRSPVLESMHNVYTITHKKEFPISYKVLKKIKDIISFEKPDVLHAFDIRVLLFVNIFSRAYRIPMITTLCGGPNPVFFPKVDDLILYSMENQRYFKSKKKFSNLKTYLIPNRVIAPIQDPQSIEKIKQRLDPSAKIFLRIARISNLHHKSIKQSINLINRLNRDGIRVQLIIIGAIQNHQVYQEILSMCSDNVILLTENEYTIDASRLINVADYVIGTGRSLMEAACCDKILLCPTSNSEIPILIDSDNFLPLFEKNFSERTVLKDLDETLNYSRILKSITDAEYMRGLHENSLRLSKKFFLIMPKVNTFQKIYHGLKPPNNLNLKDILIQMLIVQYLSLRYG